MSPIIIGLGIQKDMKSKQDDLLKRMKEFPEFAEKYPEAVKLITVDTDLVEAVLKVCALGDDQLKEISGFLEWLKEWRHAKPFGTEDHSHTAFAYFDINKDSLMAEI